MAAGDHTATGPDRRRILDKRALFSLLFLVLGLWCAHVFFLRHLTMTGDEVRYVAYGLGIFHGEGFHPSDATWQDMLAGTKVGGYLPESPAKGALIHSVAYPVLGSPFLYWGGLDGARWLSFAVGVAGIVILYAALRRLFSHFASLTAVAAIAFACPILFYLRLFFSEILLFTLNCGLAYFFASGGDKKKNLIFPMAFAVCLLPFAHLKLSLEAATAFCLLFLGYCRREPALAKRAALLLLGGAMLLLYLGHNYALFGAVVGGASPAFKMSLSAIPDRVLVNLLDSRHGLVSNAPHLLLAFVGMVWLRRDRDEAGAKLLLLFGAYFFTMLWANGSEAYAARNWVAAMPFLAFGLARWLEKAGTRDQVLAVPFLFLSLCLFCLALREPDLFLDNRSSSLAYDALFKLFPALNLGYLLPYDFLDHADAPGGSALALGIPAFLTLSLFVLGQCLAGSRRRKWLGASLQVLCLAVVLACGLVREDAVTSKAFAGAGQYQYLNLRLAEKRPVAFVRIENPPAVMKQYGFFLVGMHEVDTWTYFTAKSSIIVPFPFFERMDAIAVSEHVTRPDRVWLDTAVDARVYSRLLF